MNKQNIKPLATAVSAAFLATAAISSPAFAAENPFQADELRSGYMLAGGHAEGKCGEENVVKASAAKAKLKLKASAVKVNVARENAAKIKLNPKANAVKASVVPLNKSGSSSLTSNG